nr:hypothetical protein Iba_chr11aCG7050 [Ipomoea batatas]
MRRKQRIKGASRGARTPRKRLMTPLRFREAMRQSQCGTIRAGIVTAAVTVLQLLVEENGGRELVFLKHDVSLPGRRPIPVRRVSPSPGRRWTARSSFRRPALRRLGPRETMPHSICSTFTCNRNAPDRSASVETTAFGWVELSDGGETSTTAELQQRRRRCCDDAGDCDEKTPELSETAVGSRAFGWVVNL